MNRVRCSGAGGDDGYGVVLRGDVEPEEVSPVPRSTEEEEVDERDRLIDKIADEEARLHRCLLAENWDPLFSLNLTIQQLRSLLVISFSGGASGNELAQGLGVGLATATGIVDRLGAQGLVRRAEDPDDRRVRRVYLTQKGGELIGRLTDAGLQRKKQLLGSLGLEDLRKLEGVTGKLREAAEAQVESRPAARLPAQSG